MTDNNEPEPSDSLRAFGAAFKAFRKHAGLTQEALAPKLRYSAHFLGSVEQGRRFPPKALIDRAEIELEAFGTLRAMAQHLSRNPGLASWFRQWAALERLAVSLYTYECRLIPGLLQTEAYARTLFDNQLPPLSDAKIDAQLVARQERQQLLYERPNTAYSFILEEQLFRRCTGGVEVTRELIGHVLELARRRNIEIQVMPLVRETHAGLAGPMRLLESPEHQWFGYCEGQESGQLVSDPKVVSMLQMRYARMRSQALTLDDSLGLLEHLRGAL